MPVRQPIRFSQHAIAVFSAAMLGSTIVALVFTAWLAFATNQRPTGLTWLGTLAIATWLGVFIIALPGAAIILSALWPVTRRRTAASKAICLIGGLTGGIILAPLASSRMQGASFSQILLFATIGAAFSLIYLLLTARMSGRTPAPAPGGPTQRLDSDQLDLRR